MKKSYILMVVALLIGYASGSVIEKIRIAAPEPTGVEAGQAAGPVEPEPAEQVSDEAKGKAEAMFAEVKAEADESWVRVNELTASLDNTRAENERYKARIAELEQQLTAVSDRPERTRESWREREERMKVEEPERYEAIKKARTEFQQRMEGAIADKSAFLVNLDTSSMSEEDLKNHEELLARIAEGWDLMKQVSDGGITGREQMEAMRDNYNEVRNLYQKERDIVLRQVGESMGYDKQGASEFSTYIQDIIEKTSPRMSFGRMPGRPDRNHGDGN